MYTSAERSSSLARALGLLQTVGRAGAAGATLSWLHRRTGLPKSSIHRILADLRDAGWIDQDATSGAYLLGFQARVIGDLARRRFPLPELARLALARIAERTGQTTILSVRDGFDAVCLARVEAKAPVRAVAVDVGTVRPLGMGASATALLVDLADDELDEIVRYNAHHHPRTPLFNAEFVLEAVRRARADGHAQHNGQIARGMSGIGMPVRGVSGEIEGAISVAFVSDWFEEHERQGLVTVLDEEICRLEQQLAGHGNGSTRGARADTS